MFLVLSVETSSVETFPRRQEFWVSMTISKASLQQIDINLFRIKHGRLQSETTWEMWLCAPWWSVLSTHSATTDRAQNTDLWSRSDESLPPGDALNYLLTRAGSVCCTMTVAESPGVARENRGSFFYSNWLIIEIHPDSAMLPMSKCPVWVFVYFLFSFH